eukprot:652548-Rhodomonas_salina.1
MVHACPLQSTSACPHQLRTDAIEVLHCQPENVSRESVSLPLSAASQLSASHRWNRAFLRHWRVVCPGWISGLPRALQVTFCIRAVIC